MIPTYFERVRTQTKQTSGPAYVLILGSKILAGIATLLILHATNQGDVAVVQALGGLQYVFIIIFGIMLTLRPGKIRVETYDHEHVLQKATFIAIIALGFLVLFR